MPNSTCLLNGWVMNEMDAEAKARIRRCRESLYTSPCIHFANKYEISFFRLPCSRGHVCAHVCCAAHAFFSAISRHFSVQCSVGDQLSKNSYGSLSGAQLVT